MKEQISSTPNFELEVDVTKNRLYIKSIGFWSNEKVVRNFIDKQEEAIGKLKPKFTVVADMVEFKTLPTELVHLQQKSQMKLTLAGMFKVAEILPVNLLEQMKETKVARDNSVPNKQFASIDEAENWLDSQISNS